MNMAALRDILTSWGLSDKAVDFIEDYDLSTIHATRLLGLLLSNCRKVKGNKGSWTPSRGDTLDGLLCIVKSTQQLQPKIESRKQNLDKYEITEQPYPIVVVPNAPLEPTAYVLINGIRYLTKSPAEAIDLSFKTFMVLSASFPPEAKVPWTFIQKYLYGVVTPFDETFASAKQLWSKIGFELKTSSDTKS